jgi:hypothetical protein
MATFNAERRPPRPFGRWEFVAIVETRGCCCENGVEERLSGRSRTLIQMGGRFATGVCAVQDTPNTNRFAPIYTQVVVSVSF